MIRRRRLTRPVTLRGKNFWGFSAELTFTPTPNGEPGWFWMPMPGENPVPITADVAVSKHRRISLEYQRQMDPEGIICNLHCYEHIGVLRWSGIDGVVVSQKGFFLMPGWSPHSGRAYETWKLASESSEVTDEPIPWVTIPDTVQGRRNQRSGYTQLEPIGKDAEGRHAALTVYCNYPAIGTGTIHYRIPPGKGEVTETGLESFMAVHTQGFPKLLFYPSLLASILGWPHHDHAIWPQYERERTIGLFLAHRVSDLLGSLSLVDHVALPAVQVISYLSGHGPDLEAVKKARTLIGADPPRAA